MFDIGTKIKRAWNTVWNYKVLWVFAFLMVLTGAGGGGGGGGGGSSYSGNAGNMFQNGDLGSNDRLAPWMREMGAWMEKNVEPLFATPEKAISTAIWIGAGIFLFALAVGTLMALVRYPSETAIIRMVDEYEQTGNKIKFKQGWKLGWSRRAFRLWVIDLIIGVPAFLFILIIMGLGVLIFIKVSEGDKSAVIASTIAILGFGFVFILAFGLVMAFVGLLRQFIARAAALEDATIGESFKRGWHMVTHNFRNAALTWLVMVGIGIGFGFATLFALIILIPAFALMAIPGALVSAIPGAIAYIISSAFTSSPLTWIITALVAMPFFFTIVFSPASLLSALYMLFESSIWTQTYREMKAGSALPPALPIPETTSNKTFVPKI
ncbi:MAG: hypothetical protein FD147_2333 [Chloroflexi bacterium]|nr:MAG: hypothetical protein FD147_2333 [Chloroflexota bacterium]